MKPNGQMARLLAFVRANPGASIADIQLGMRPFIANPRARISDLRSAGFLIECRREQGVDRYYVEARPAPLLGVQEGMAL